MAVSRLEMLVSRLEMNVPRLGMNVSRLGTKTEQAGKCNYPSMLTISCKMETAVSTPSTR